MSSPSPPLTMSSLLVAVMVLSPRLPTKVTPVVSSDASILMFVLSVEASGKVKLVTLLPSAILTV